MLQLTQGFVLGVLGLFLGQQPAAPVRWACRPLSYLENPAIRGSKFTTRLTADCDFDAIHGGGYPHLRAHLVDRVIREAETVHAGPTSVVYRKVPGQSMNVTTRVGNATDYSRVRQNVYVATNETSTLYFDSFSVSVTGEGRGAYLKKSDVMATVSNTPTAGTYGVRMEAYVEAEKPWYIPAEIFLSQIRRAIENNTQRIEEELVVDLANNL